MNPSSEVSADAANDAYKNHLQSDVDNNKKRVNFDGQQYTVFDYMDDPKTGFHATAYKGVAPPHNVIIAYRGTDLDYRHHTRTTAQDAYVDFMMVKGKINLQEADARAFTQQVLDKAQEHGISKDQITVAGQSLGGTHAEIEASKFGLRGMTLNAYGAVDLGYGVPEGGTQMTNYVMAGDVVSAASRHYGVVVPLASSQDLTKLREARYLDAPLGAAVPNPLIAIRLGDHGMTNFIGPNSVLKPENLAQAQQNYTDNKAAIDHFRGDVYTDRAELAMALRNPGSHNLATTWANLSPQMQQQLAEYHAHLVDGSVQSAVEHNRAVEGIKWGLDESAAAFQAGGQRAQQAADQTAQRFHAAGQTVQQQADNVPRGATAFMQAAPLAVGGVALGAVIAGRVARAEADGYANASHLAGQAVHVGSQFVAGQYEAARHTVETGAHLTAQAATQVVHTQESMLVRAADLTFDTYQGATHTYDAARQAVSHGVDAVEHAAGQAYDRLKHPGQWFEHDAPSPRTQTNPLSTPLHNQAPAITSPDPDYARNDPRHPDNPHHGLYEQLKARVPEASEKRLLQFSDACHSKGMGEKNLGEITFDRHGGQMIFHPSFTGPLAAVDVKQPSPQPAQSIQHIQQADQTQAQIQTQIQAQNAQFNQQGLTPGGR